MPTPVTETYATAEDGVVLTWDVYLPDSTQFPSPWPVTVVIHAGLFVSGNSHDSPKMRQCCADQAAAGYAAVSINYRVAPGGNGTPKGLAPNFGRYPDQNNDAKRACKAAAAPPGGSVLIGKVTGQVGIIGGSSGAYLAGDLCVDTTTHSLPVPWVDANRPLGAVLISGALDMGDTTPSTALAKFQDVCANYTNPPTTVPLTAPELAQMHAQSPIVLATATAKPMWIRNGDNETMPKSQMDLFIAALDAKGVTNYTRVLDTGQDGQLHSWDAYPKHAQEILAFITQLYTGSSTPPPQQSKYPKGVSALPQSQAAHAQAVLDNPDITMVAIGLDWADFEPTSGNFVYTFIDSEIRRAAAMNKRILLRIPTMNGANHFDGNTPDHVFDAIKASVGGPPTSFSGGSTTAGSPLVSCPNAVFNFADIGDPITGTNIPPNSYVGHLESGAASLSSDPVTDTPVNATGTGTGITITLPLRPQAGSTSQDTVFGTTYTYAREDPVSHVTKTICIPVFWEPTYLSRKKRMLNALGNHVTNGTTLTPKEKQAIAVVSVAVCNAQSEDWSIPNDNSIAPGFPISQVDAWLNGPRAQDVYPGAGYQSHLVIQAGINQLSGNQFVDGVTTTGSAHLTSNTANFMIADEGHPIALSGFLSKSKILKWVSSTEVILDNNATATATGVSFSIKQRVVGLLDIAMAAFPNQSITTAIGNNGTDLDAVEAEMFGDADVDNYVARALMTASRTHYPGRQIAQVNSFMAQTTDASALPGHKLKLLNEIALSGAPTAGQNLWVVTGDESFRMNKGVPDDPTTILQNTGIQAATYEINYLEVYGSDCINLTGAIAFIANLLNPQPKPPPPPQPSTTPPPFHAPIRSVNFRDLLYSIAALLGVDPRIDLSPDIAANWTAHINRHVRYAWEFWDWPELFITEERAYRQIWEQDNQYALGDEVYYLATSTYYLADPSAFNPPTPGLAPDGVGNGWIETTLPQRYVALDQDCRRAIGQIQSVFTSNPYTTRPYPIDFVLSERGLESRALLGEWSGLANNTIFIHYKQRPYIYTSAPFDRTVSYRPPNLVFWTDGEVYRCRKPVRSVGPTDATGDTFWTFVPFPYVISEYVIYRAAADACDDLQTRGDYRSEAERALQRETDKTIEQGKRSRYRLTRPSPYSCWILPCLADGTTPGAVLSTLTDLCVNPYGEFVPE